MESSTAQNMLDLLSTVKGGKVVVDSGIPFAYGNSRTGSHHQNFVWGKVSTETLRMAKQEFGRDGYGWWVTEDARDDREKLKETGHTFCGLTPEMSCDIAGPQKKGKLIDALTKRIEKKYPDLNTLWAQKKFTIEKVTKDEFQDFVDSQKELFPEIPQESTQKFYERSYLPNIDKNVMFGFLARLDKKSVGSVLTYLGKKTVGVYSMCVSKEERHKGIGTALIRYAIEHTPMPDNTEEIVGTSLFEAVGFYQRLGAGIDVSRGLAYYVMEPKPLINEEDYFPTL